MPTPIQRRLASFLLLATCLLLPACGADGHFSILGYTTVPTYDCSIRTVYVPIFQNVTFRRGLEFDLTRAVIREIEAKTPYKTTSSRSCADTELLGKITSSLKRVINYNQVGEVREAETNIGVELVWRDLRAGHTGQVLSRGSTREAPEPDAPPVPIPPDIGITVGSFIPELGGSITTAEKEAIDRLAVQIVSKMEKPW
jgi:hypothetical protein